MMKTRLLDWRSDGNTMVAPSTATDGSYRIVYSHGYHCLRFEPPNDHPFWWMGQFDTVARAKLIAQEHMDGERRLKAWDRYMRKNDPPTDDPDWLMS